MAAQRRFDPRRLKYDADWIPVLSTEKIEDIATEVLELYCPQVLKENQPCKTPVLEIVQGLEKTTGLKLAFADLGRRAGQKILGKVSFAKKTLYVDHCLTAGPLEKRLQFTAAHEVGHWVLHRYSYPKWKFTIDKDGSLDDDPDSLHKLADGSPRDWLEFQANVFASALTMPRLNFQFALAKSQYALGIRRQVGTIFLNGTTAAELDMYRAIEELEKVYCTSKQAVEIRLQTLKLIETQPPLLRKSRKPEFAWPDMDSINPF